MPQIISVIVPVYNLEDYIQHTLDTIFAQTHKELEVIAIDDGSTDASPAILDEYAKRELRLKVVHQQNAGVSSARNAGLAVATGDYIGFCDGDDEMEPTMIEHLLANLVKYNADISHCGMLTVGLDGQTRYFHNTGVLEVHSHEQGLLELLKGDRVEPSLWNKLYKRKLFQNIMFDEDILYNEDLLNNVRLFLKARKTVFEDVCLYRYVRRTSSACKNGIAEKHVFHPVEVRERIIELCSKENELIQKQAMNNYLHANMSAFGLVLEKRARHFRWAKSQFRQNLLQYRDYASQLDFSGRVHFLLIHWMPFFCGPILSIYYFFKSKKRYG